MCSTITRTLKHVRIGFDDTPPPCAWLLPPGAAANLLIRHGHEGHFFHAVLREMCFAGMRARRAEALERWARKRDPNKHSRKLQRSNAETATLRLSSREQLLSNPGAAV